MDKETEIYFHNYNLLFSSAGWQQFIKDLEETMEALSTIAGVKDEKDLYIKQGQVLQLNNILNLEAGIVAAQEQATDGD